MRAPCLSFTLKNRLTTLTLIFRVSTWLSLSLSGCCANVASGIKRLIAAVTSANAVKDFLGKTETITSPSRGGSLRVILNLPRARSCDWQGLSVRKSGVLDEFRKQK